MKPVDQSILHDPDNGKNGDCWRACIASVLELPIEDVPHFADMKDVRTARMAELKFLAKHGFTAYTIYGEENMNDHPNMLPEDNEYYFAIGPSPRDKNINHQVVCHNGEIVHDPHPDKTGLAGISYFEIMLKI